MCPCWNRVADEIEALASDRLLAAHVEPDGAERRLLAREARLLQMAADAALSRPGDAFMVHSACQGVVVHCDLFVLWGISRQAEDGLRELAARADPGAALDVDALEALRVVLGIPLQPADHACPHEPVPTPRPRLPTRQGAAAIVALAGSVAALVVDAAPAALSLL